MQRTTTPSQRIDLLLTQAEQFAEYTGAEEAIARARQAIAYAKIERGRTTDPAEREALGERIRLAETLIQKLGASIQTDEPTRARVPESWDV